jgi:hypothetical protein
MIRSQLNFGVMRTFKQQRRLYPTIDRRAYDRFTERINYEFA